MGHEFSGYVEAIGGAVDRPELKVGAAVTANPLVSCGKCRYCLSGKQQLCPSRKLLGAHLPGSNAEFVAIRADALFLLPSEFLLVTAALVEPAAFATHVAALAKPSPDEQALVVGAGPIGLMVIQTLAARGVNQVFCIDLTAERLAWWRNWEQSQLPSMKSHPNQWTLLLMLLAPQLHVRDPYAQYDQADVLSGAGLHEADTTLPVNDFIRREITTYGSFAYTPIDFDNALQALAQKRITLEDAWTQTELLENGTACYEKLLHGAPISKIWLTPKG